KRTSSAAAAAAAPTGVLPTTAPPTRRHPKRTVQNCTNLKLTILCGIITVLVFRGTIGISYFTAPFPGGGGADRSHSEDVDRILARILHEDGDDGDETPSPPITTSTYSLGPKVKDWDRSRRKWIGENPSHTAGRPRIMLATASPPYPCRDPIGDHYLLKSIKNKVDYCRIHGIEIIHSMATLDEHLTGEWSKLPLIRKLMVSHPDVEWLWWMDGDAFLTDMKFRIPISKYEEHNLVVHGCRRSVYEERSWIGLTAGSFLLRNCEWSLELLDSWASMGPKGRIREEAGRMLTRYLKGRPESEADDRSALIYLLTAARGAWKEKVFVE
ncbi:hypothetical protein M569_11153, partial [Genlisea aurea]